MEIAALIGVVSSVVLSKMAYDYYKVASELKLNMGKIEREKDNIIRSLKYSLDDQMRNVRILDNENYKLKTDLLKIKMNGYQDNIDMHNEKDTELIKKAVRQAMIKCHPDKSNNSSTEEFMAYKKLYDDLKGWITYEN